MTKLAFIVATLFPEADDEENRQVKKDVRKELKMPYLPKVEKATVLHYEMHHRMPDGKKVKCHG